MRKNGVNQLFIREVSDRIKKLKGNPSLIDSDLVQKLDNNLRRLEDAVELSGVPPPVDMSVNSLNSSNLSAPDFDKSLELDDIRKMNEKIRSNVLSQLEDFKSAKQYLISIEKSYDFDPLNKLMQEKCAYLDEAMSDNDKNVQNSSPLAKLMEMENTRLKHQISEAEDLKKSKETNQCGVCKCILF